MANPRNKVEMFWAMKDHQAFVRHEMWPELAEGLWWVVYCPGCEQMCLDAYHSWTEAHRAAVMHRLNEEAWIPVGENPYGPVANWGAQPM